MSGARPSQRPRELRPLSPPTNALDDNDLYSLVRRETRDADEQAACLRDWDQVYEQLSPGQFEGRFMECRPRHPGVSRGTNQSVHEAGLMRAGGACSACRYMQGQGYFCGRPIRADAIMTMRGGDELDFARPSSSTSWPRRFRQSC
jgi:AraC family ethanolamine operon transcriptional activator